MNYTQNHHLPQWIKSDPIRMEDFNDAMASIESGLNTADTALSKAGAAQSAASSALSKANAAQSAAQTAQSVANAAQSAANRAFSTENMPFVVGSYVGCGTEAAHIGLGFKPSLVIVSGVTESASGFDPAYFVITRENQNVCRRLDIMPKGFCAYPDGNQGVTYPRMNELGRTYDYIAFR